MSYFGANMFPKVAREETDQAHRRAVTTPG